MPIEDPSAPNENQATGSNWFNNLFETLTSRITMIGGVVAGLITLNSGLSSFTNENLARTKAFEERVTAENEYWEGRYNKYLEIIDATSDPDDEMAQIQRDALRREQLKVLLKMVQYRTVPDFEGYFLGFFGQGEALRKAEYLRLAAMKKDLEDLMIDNSGKDLKEPLAEAATADNVRARDASGLVLGPDVTPPESAQQPAVSNIVALSYDAQILATGARNGYDIDVFWCEGEDQERLFSLARNVSLNLAKASNDSTRIGGVPLGRIRLRPLLKSFQLESRGYPSQGLVIRHDSNFPDELPLGRALQAEFQRSSGTLFELKPSASLTKYYLSVFVCSLPTSPPVVPE